MSTTVQKSSRFEIKLAGFGGQGIALMGSLIGKAAQLFSTKFAVFTQSYGPESRGGASSADVVIDDNVIDYPYTEAGHVDIFVVMSKEAYFKFVNYLAINGQFFYDTDLVPIDDKAKVLTNNIFGIPATKLAEDLGMRMVANVIMLGFVTKHSLQEIFPSDAMKQSILSSVPSKFKEINSKAFDIGYNYKINNESE